MTHHKKHHDNYEDSEPPPSPTSSPHTKGEGELMNHHRHHHQSKHENSHMSTVHGHPEHVKVGQASRKLDQMLKENVPSESTITAANSNNSVTSVESVSDPVTQKEKTKCCQCCSSGSGRAVAILSKLCGGEHNQYLLPASLSPNKLALLFFKILALKSFQLCVASVVTYYFQMTWKFQDKKALETPPVVAFARQYYWTVLPALICYGAFRVDIRCQKQKVISTSLLVYLIQTGNIGYICFICGLNWELIMAPVVTMTLSLAYLILALVPFTVENGAPSTKVRTHIVATILTLILSLSCWFLMVGFLAYFKASVTLALHYEDWYTTIFMYWFPSFLVSEFLCMFDVYELRKIFQGHRIPLSENSWMFVSVYL